MRIAVRCFPLSKCFLSAQFSPRHNDQSSERSLELLCFSNVRPSQEMSAITESNCRKPQPVHNQNVIAQFVNQSERAYEIFRSVPESYGPVIDQSQHSYHLCHIIKIFISLNCLMNFVSRCFRNVASVSLFLYVGVHISEFLYASFSFTYIRCTHLLKI